jgi:hypothetical protein
MTIATPSSTKNHFSGDKHYVYYLVSFVTLATVCSTDTVSSLVSFVTLATVCSTDIVSSLVIVEESVVVD